MLSLSGSCIPLKVNLTVIKKSLLVLPSHYRVSKVSLQVLLGDLNRTFNLFKWILREKTKRFIQ